MTQPNLDALAKLGPFRIVKDWEGQYSFFSPGRSYIEPEDALAIANEWVELRAYRERTEAALVQLTAMLEAVFAANPNSSVDGVLRKMDVELDLYRDQATKENTDGN